MKPFESALTSNLLDDTLLGFSVEHSHGSVETMMHGCADILLNKLINTPDAVARLLA